LVAWEFMTAPGRRAGWQTGVTGVEIVAEGKRRGVGATTHCMHGKAASIEEALDWRPCDYYTIRNNVPTPLGMIRFLQTTEFEPTPSGTVIHMRMAAPKSRKELITMKAARPMLEAGLRIARASLVAQLDAELERRTRGDVAEPDLPRSRPDGVLAEFGTQP
jgi:hypothetical protein